MDNFGLVSIITPSYNSSSFIAETIESILSQTYLNWELLITDDCSTDRSVEIIERYIQRDSRIKLFRFVVTPRFIGRSEMSTCSGFPLMRSDIFSPKGETELR